MNLNLRRLEWDDLYFAFECMKELAGYAKYSTDEFEKFIKSENLIDHPDFWIVIAETECDRIGVISMNRYAMPRYIGFGIEIEEFIIHPNFQGKGYGKQVLKKCFEFYCGDSQLRRITVKSGGNDIASRLYKKHFDIMEMSGFVKKMNYI